MLSSEFTGSMLSFSDPTHASRTQFENQQRKLVYNKNSKYDATGRNNKQDIVSSVDCGIYIGQKYQGDSFNLVANQREKSSSTCSVSSSLVPPVRPRTCDSPCLALYATNRVCTQPRAYFANPFCFFSRRKCQRALGYLPVQGGVGWHA